MKEGVLELGFTLCVNWWGQSSGEAREARERGEERAGKEEGA